MSRSSSGSVLGAMVGTSMLLLLMPADCTRPVAVEVLRTGMQLELARRDGMSAQDPTDDPSAAEREKAAKEAMESLTKDLADLKTKLQGSGGQTAQLWPDIQKLVQQVCNCSGTGLTGFGNGNAGTILDGLDSTITDANQKLTRVKNLPASEFIEKKNLLIGKLLQVPYVAGSYPDHVVKLKNGSRPPVLVDPPDKVRREMTSHFMSLTTSRSASKASMNVGIPLESLVPAAASTGVGAVAGVVASALNLKGSVTAGVDWSKQEESMQKHEIDVSMIHEPRGALNIDMADLELVDAAKDELKHIASEDDLEVRKGKITKFIQRFGSHVCHKVTLGGTRFMRSILKTSAKQKSETVAAALKIAAAKNRTQEAIGAPKSDMALSIGGGTSSTNFALAQQVNLEKEELGGEPGLATGLWIQSLAYNENWDVINQHITDCTPVWDFVDQDKESFGVHGKKLPQEMFQVWYTEFLNLKQFSKTHPGDLPANFTGDRQLAQWISDQYDKLKPNLLNLKQCSALSWCNGYGECSEKTGQCDCYADRVKHEGKCYPKKQKWLLARWWDFLCGHPDEPDLSIDLGAGPSAQLAVDENPWDDSYVYVWVQQLHGGNASSTEVARLERALAAIIEKSESKDELTKTLEKSVKAMEALVEILSGEDYRARFLRDAEDVASALELKGEGLDTTLEVAPTPEAKEALSGRIFAFTTKVRDDPEFLQQVIADKQARIERRRAVLRQLKEGGTRQMIAKELRERAQNRLTGDAAAAAAAVAGTASGTEAADEDTAKGTLVGTILPLQNKASEEVVADFEAMKSGADGA